MKKKTHTNPFSQQDIAILKASPYVASVSEMTVRFTEEFKDIAYAEKRSGTPLPEIFRMHGIDPAILGSSRVEGFSYTLNRRNRKEDLDQKRSNTSYQHPPKTGEESLLQRIEQLEYELAYTRQEVEFLKKIQEAGMEGRKVWESRYQRK
ncbi:HTH domain-containing protein [Erysipelotrichaceae bacterium 66-17]